MSWFDKLSAGLSRSRERFNEQINVIFDRGPALDDEFWDNLEETLILGDMGASAAVEIVEQLQATAQRLALPDGYAVFDYLADTIAGLFTDVEAPAGTVSVDEASYPSAVDNEGELLTSAGDPFAIWPVCVLFVGINGAGKTTTVGKIAKDGVDRGRSVLLGSGDTFRAAAIEQLDIWGERAGVEVIKRERGSDPASVCFEVIERAEQQNANLVLIDTAGRLHTSDDLMRELEKVVNVTRKRAAAWNPPAGIQAPLPVKTVLVMDATTGQNGMQQAREFNKALNLDGVILTKLDGTAKGGIAVAVSHELKLPILRIGVGEQIEDLRPFDAHDFATALIGDTRK